MSAFIDVTIISLALSFVLSLLYRFLTKPGEMQRIKKEMAYYRKKSSEAQKAGNSEKANEYLKESMKLTQQQFKQNMKPMMASMLVFIIILGWMNGAYGSIIVDLNKNPDSMFSYGGAEHRIYYENVTQNDKINMRGGVDFNNDGRFSSDEIFDENEIFSYKGIFWRVKAVTENAVSFEMLVVKAPVSIPIIGYYLSWFWWYILITIPCTMLFRKLLGVD